jgi:hypothetical protein
MIKVHHVDALRDYAEATQDNLSKLAKRISEQTTLLWNRMEEISSKAAVNSALRPIRAISKIATTITAHRLDRAVMDLVNVQNVFSEYAEKTRRGRMVHRARRMAGHFPSRCKLPRLGGDADGCGTDSLIEEGKLRIRPL